MKNMYFCIICIIIFSGCTSLYNKFYTQIISNDDLNYLKKNRQEVFLQHNQEPRIYTTNDMLGEHQALQNKGCIVLGESAFFGPLQDTSNVKSKARELGAKLVLLKNPKYSHTNESSGVVPIPKTTTTQYSGNMKNSYGHNVAGFNATSTTQGTAYIPYRESVRIYDQGALFYLCD